MKGFIFYFLLFEVCSEGVMAEKQQANSVRRSARLILHSLRRPNTGPIFIDLESSGDQMEVNNNAENVVIGPENEENQHVGETGTENQNVQEKMITDEQNNVPLTDYVYDSDDDFVNPAP